MADGRRLVVVGREEPLLVEPKAHLLEALLRGEVPIRTSCGGVGTCGLCRVTVCEGGEHLTELKGVEEHHLGNVAAIVGLRLACQARFAREGVVRVDVPPPEDLQERRKRKLERARAAEAEGEGKGGSRAKAARVEWRPRKLAGAAERAAASVRDATPAREAPPPEPRASRVSKRPASG